MNGLEIVDLVATSALLRDKVGRDWRLTPYQKGLLVSILTGSFRPCSRLFKAGLRETDRCPHCNMDVAENKKHVFWECPAWNYIRNTYFILLHNHDFITDGEGREGTEALWQCGLMNEDPLLLAAKGDIDDDFFDEEPDVTDSPVSRGDTQVLLDPICEQRIRDRNQVARQAAIARREASTSERDLRERNRVARERAIERRTKTRIQIHPLTVQMPNALAQEDVSDDEVDNTYDDDVNEVDYMEPDNSIEEEEGDEAFEFFDQYGRRVVASDGSAVCPKDDRLRRCGYGLYYGPGHPRNVSLPLRGPCQTVPRAELRAVLHCFKVATVPTVVLCDCLFVVKGVQQILLGSQPTRLDHQDLWKRIRSTIQFRGAEFFGIRKVKAHVTQQQVDEGVITEFERMMNEGVDGLAKSAANAHAIDPELASKAYRRSWVTKYIQDGPYPGSMDRGDEA